MSLLGTLALAAAVTQSPSPPTFAGGTSAVYVDVFLGGEAAGRVASDFEVRDNGVRQSVALAGTSNLPLTVVMVFDVSESVRGDKLEQLRQAGHALLDGLGEKDQAALVTFSQRVSLVVPAGAPRADLGAAIDHLEAGGATSLWDAVYAGLLAAPVRGGGMVVLFTDGEDAMSWLSAEQVAAVAEQSNAIVHVVALEARQRVVGTRGVADLEVADVAALRALAEASGGRFWEAGSSAGLKATFLAIVKDAQSRSVLTFEPTAAQPGWHRLEVKVRGRGRVRSRRGYMVSAGGE